MNKDEQKKIYSSYFPYKLEVLHVDTDWAEDRETTAILTGVFEDCLTFNQASDYYYKDEQIVIKPILYDLSFLTKEIENEGERFVPTRWLRDNHAEFDISKADMEQLISMFIHVFRSPESAPYYFIKKLLEWHFNVFQLPEDQFINKATLTNK